VSLAVQLQDAGNVVGATGLALLAAELIVVLRHHRRTALEPAAVALFVVAETLDGTGSLMRSQWGQAALNFALAAWFAWLLWRRWRKHRKAVAALLGAKSRALRDALVRKQRELARPRPLLRPVPQGGPA
jgi:hypothetical protein